jgi:hypothetical protein
MTSPTVQRLIDEALELNSVEQAELIGQVATALAHRAASEEIHATDTAPYEHWGQSVYALIQSLDLSDWDDPQYDDSVAWLKRLREQEDKARNLDWGDTE